MSHLSTHVLDAVQGRPAAGIRVFLLDGHGHRMSDGVTDGDGRITKLGPDQLASGSYLLVFETEPYFAAQGIETFYPRVRIEFTVADSPHYHVPVLLSPYSYTTYRGS